MLLSGAIIMFVVQILKKLGLKREYVKFYVFLLAIILGILQSFNKSLAETVIAILGSGVAAIGIYETTLKKAKKKV